MSGAAIHASGLTRRFGDTTALHGLDLEVAPGTVFGYIGPNGSGKTTTVRILTGLLPADGGSARVAGVDPAADPRHVKRLVGYVPEHVALYDGLTAREHLRLVGRLRRLDDAVIARRSEALLDVLALADRGDDRIGGYSKGMRQKVGLAAALLHGPRVLFLDEPLTGLDLSSTLVVKAIVRAVADAGGTVFYCSHMLDVVERTCDRVAVLREGRVVADAAPSRLMEGGGDTLEGVVRTLTGGGVAPGRVAALVRELQS